MQNVIFVDPSCREGLARVLKEILETDSRTAQAIVADGAVESAELFNYRHQLKTFPSSRSVDKTLAARLYDDQFFQKSGLGRSLFVELYDNTIEEAAKREGREDSIDSQSEVAWLRERLPQTLRAKKAVLLNELRKAMERLAASEVKNLQVSRSGGIYRVIIQQDEVPASAETFRELFYEKLTTEFPKYVIFFQNPRRITTTRPLPPDVDYLMATEIETPILSNRSAYVGVSFREEKIEGRKKQVITWRQLSPEEERDLGLAPFETGMKYLHGETTITELPSGELSLTIDIQCNPNIGKVAYALGSLLSGFDDPILEKGPPLILNAARSVARFVARREYYQRCILGKNPSCSSNP